MTNLPNDPNIETTDENLNLDLMFTDFVGNSLPRQIFETLKMNGATAALFGATKDGKDGGFKILRQDVNVYPSSPLKTGLSTEVLQYLNSVFNLNEKNLVRQYIETILIQDENKKCLEFLEQKSEKHSVPLVLEDKTNAETISFTLGAYLGELALTYYNEFRPFSGFAVLPLEIAKGVMMFVTQTETVKPENRRIDQNEKPYFIGRLGKFEIYINPDKTQKTTGYFGFKGAGYFADFDRTYVQAQEDLTGNTNIFVYDRYAIAENPLNQVHKGLIKFDIQ